MLIIQFFLPKFVHITKGTFHLNFAIVLLIRTRISLMPSAIHLFFQVPAQTWHLKFMKLVGFKQKHLNGTDFIWRLFFFFVVIIIMVVSFNLTDFFSWNSLTHFQMTRMRKWWVVILLKYRFCICTDVWKQLGIYLANIEFFSVNKLVNWVASSDLFFCLCYFYVSCVHSALIYIENQSI